MKKLLVLCGLFLVTIALLMVMPREEKIATSQKSINSMISVSDEVIIKTPTPTPLPQSKILQNDYHIFQTFNNCGPAALSMILSYYGIYISQQELGNELRPNQNPRGIRDDKSVTLDELALKSKQYNLIPYHRPNGSVELVKQLISNNMPVIARTWLKKGEDIGHYRVVKGYDDSKHSFLQDDSLQGKNLWYSYDEFNALWEAFNFEYLVLVPSEKEMIARTILNDDFEERKSWEKAAIKSSEKYTGDPSNIYAGFNASVAYYRTGKYDKSIEYFERVENQLPRRMLWYQLDPIQSYLAVQNYEKVRFLTSAILSTENNAHAELYLMQAEIAQQTNDLSNAKMLYQQAILYDRNLLKHQTILSHNSVRTLELL